MRIGEAQKVKTESQLKTSLDRCRKIISQVKESDGGAAAALDAQAADLADRIERLKLLTNDEGWDHLRCEAEDMLLKLEEDCRQLQA
jgi:hypothetical protein